MTDLVYKKDQFVKKSDQCIESVNFAVQDYEPNKFIWRISFLKNRGRRGGGGRKNLTQAADHHYSAPCPSINSTLNADVSTPNHTNNTKKCSIWALHLYRIAESSKYIDLTFDIHFYLTRVFNVETGVIEKSIYDLKFLKTTCNNFQQKYFIRWFTNEELSMLMNGQLQIKLKIDVKHRQECIQQSQTIESQDQLENFRKNPKNCTLFNLLFPHDDELAKKANSTDRGDEDEIFLISNEGRKFKCSRSMLASESDVFSTMFSYGNSNFVENLKKEIHMDDVDSETMVELLRFIYTNTVDHEKLTDHEGLAMKCLLAAEKYMLDKKFKLQCADIMLLAIDDQNVREYYQIADSLGLESLKRCAQDFIAQYCDFVDYP